MVSVSEGKNSKKVTYGWITRKDLVGACRN